jgi:hypothetical protein
MEKYKELKTLVDSMEEDVTKFYNKGNSKAGVRVRASLQDVKDIAQAIRFEISAIKKNETDANRNTQ